MTIPLPPPDQDQRDLAVTTTDRPVTVMAGAGTGKTTLLVERLYRLLATGTATIGQVLVVTFTEKAAGELRARLRDRLERGRRADPSDQRLRSALQDLDGAAISTIHAFCAAVLRDHAREAGLSPAAQVIDPLQAEILEADLWREWLQQELDRPGTPLDDAISAGVALSKLRELALVAASQPGWEHLPAGDPPDGDDVAQFVDQLDDWVNELDAMVLEGNPDPGDLALPEIAKVIDLATRLPHAPRAAWPHLLDTASWKSNVGQKDNWRIPVAEVKGLLKTIQDTRKAALEVHRGQVVASLVPLAWDYVRYARQRRRSLAMLSFDDLLFEADQLIQAHPSVRASLRHRFRHVLVDEFQDTDPLQARILETLACPADEDLPQRMFVVGDPKQSIYRFRQADLRIYRSITTRLADAGVEASITRNFRSVPGVLDWVNEASTSLFGPQPGWQHQAPYVAIDAARPAAEPPCVWVLQPPLDEAARADARRDHEAAHVADVIRRGLQTWVIGDGSQRRPATAGDIAILVPTRAGIPGLVRALEAIDVATVVESAAGFFAQDEVGDLVNLLRAVDSPFNGVAIVAALRSAAFACTDDDLVAWAWDSGRSQPWDYHRLPPDAHGPVADALRILHQLHQERLGISLPSAVDRILEVTGLRVRMAALRGHFQPVANLDRIRDLARAYEDRRGTSLTGMARWLEERRLDPTRQADDGARLDIENLDAVRLMTIHNAKGLEFPVTIVAGLGTEVRRGNRPAQLLRHDGRLEAAMSGVLGHTARTAAFTDAKQADDAEEDAELRRLLYVATTRARDVLVVSLHGVKAPGADAASSTSAHYGTALYPMLAWDGPQVVMDPAPTAAAPAPPPLSRSASTVPPDRQDAVTRRSAIVTAAALPLPRVTASGHQAHEDPEPVPVVQAEEARESAALRGQLFHLALERIDLDSPGDPLALVREIASVTGDIEESTDAALQEVAGMVQDFLRSEWPDRIRASRRAWRELPYALALDGAVLTGAMDLVLEDAPGDLIVVDYKTDRAGQGASRHALQGGMYALALQQVTGRAPRDVAFYFARSGRTETVPVTAQLLDLARQRLLAAGSTRPAQASLDLGGP